MWILERLVTEMIYTVTLNPGLDLLLALDEVELGTIMRPECRGLVAGGKGINVSLMLLSLGIKSTALGFTAGMSGAEIENQLASKGVLCDFVRLQDGFSRINVKLNAKEETELNCKGPKVSESELNAFFEKIEKIPSGSFVTLSGNIQPSLPKDIYLKIMEVFEGKDIRTAVDVAGERLKELLKFKPFVIKPNNYELEELFETKIRDENHLLELGERLREMGAENVIISLGAKGSVLISDSGAEKFGIVSGEVINTTGAGDSMLAGFLAGIERGYSKHKAMLLATSCGSATSFSVGIASGELTEECFERLLKIDAENGN